MPEGYYISRSNCAHHRNSTGTLFYWLITCSFWLPTCHVCKLKSIYAKWSDDLKSSQNVNTLKLVTYTRKRTMPTPQSWAELDWTIKLALTGIYLHIWGIFFCQVYIKIIKMDQNIYVSSPVGCREQVRHWIHPPPPPPHLQSFEHVGIYFKWVPTTYERKVSWCGGCPAE